MAWRALLSALFILLVAGVLVGQEITGTISGTVTDSSGAVVVGAKVTITDINTKVVVRTQITDSAGLYVAPLLPIGHYTVSAEAKGFKTASQTNVELNVNDKIKINLTMEVGDVKEVVTVEASAVSVELESSHVANVMTGETIREMPLTNRVYEGLVAFVPGVSSISDDLLYVGTTNPMGTNTLGFGINGNRRSANNWTVDGADNVDRGSNLTLLTYPSVDSIAEFKVARAMYSADSGRAGGAQISVMTRSGTSSFHGSAYEFFKNNVLNANNFISNANKVNPDPVTGKARVAPLHYNNFGWTFGGPVHIPRVYNADKKKTFFFWSQEYRRIITYTTQQATLPTADEIKGIFTQPVCVGSIASSCAGGTILPAGTPIPSIDPIAQQYIKDIYSKIAWGTPTNRSVYSLFRNVSNYREDLIKVDHNFTSNLSGFLKFTNDSIPTIEPGGLFTSVYTPGPTPDTSVSRTTTNSPGKSVVGHITHMISPSFINEAAFNYSYGAIVSDATGLGSSAISTDIKPNLPFPVTLGRIPTTTPGYGSIYGFGPYRDYNRNYTWYDNVTKITGKMTLKFGATMNFYQKTENAAGNNVGTIATTYTNRPTSATTTNAQQWANFLQGYLSSFSQSSVDLTPDIRQKQFESFVQDDWRIKPNLTLNIGVRYSNFRQPYDANHMLTNFNPAFFNAAKSPAITASGTLASGSAYDPTNGVIINAGATCPVANGCIGSVTPNSPYGNAVAPQSNLNFAPRFGFAWDPFETGKTSIRGGYGLYYDSATIGNYESNIFYNPPFVTTATWTTATTSTGIPLQQVTLQNLTGGVPAALTLKSVKGTPTSGALPYSQQWSFGIQREIMKNTKLDVSYVGSKGTHLLGTTELNDLPAGFALAAGLQAPGQQFTSATSPVLNQIRPYKGFVSVNQIQNWYNSSYHSLQVYLEKRFSGGSQFTAAYTFSKTITDSWEDSGYAPMDTYNRKLERGLARLDRPHILALTYIYHIPFFRQSKGIVGHALGGWELAGNTAINSGSPATVTISGIDPAGLGYLPAITAGGRPLQVCNPNENAPHTLQQWFNTSCFTAFPTGANIVGNAGRGVVRGPGYQTWNVSLYKNFRVTERIRLQFRGETVNFPNHTNFSGFGTAITTPSTFGQITSTRFPRQTQIGLKLEF